MLGRLVLFVAGFSVATAPVLAQTCTTTATSQNCSSSSSQNSSQSSSSSNRKSQRCTTSTVNGVATTNCICTITVNGISAIIPC